MNLQITAKLQKIIKSEMSEITVSEFSAVENYHAKVLEIANIEFLLITNDTTLYSFFFPMPENGVTDMEYFEYYVSQSIFKLLHLGGFAQDEFEQILDIMQNFNYSKSSDRSVISSMNNMGLFLENWVYDKLDLVEINQRINTIPFSKIGDKYGVELFKELLQ